MEQENRLKKKIIKWTMIFLGVVLVFTVISKTIYTFLLPTVSIGKMSSGRIQEKVIASGTVGHDMQLIKAKKIKVQANLGGKITACYVEEGQRVKKGESLFQITGTLDETVSKQQEQQRIEIGINKESLERERKTYEKQLEKALEDLKEKQEEIKNKEKSLEDLQLEEKIADKKQEIACNEPLYESGAISEKEYTKAKEALELLLKEKEEKEEEEKKTEERELQALKDAVELIKNQLATNDERLQLENNKLLTQQAEGSQKVVVSPIDGIVYEIDVATDANVVNGDQLLIVVPHTIPITLSFNVNDSQSNKLKPDQEVKWIMDQRHFDAVIKKKTYDEALGMTTVSCEIDEELTKDLLDEYRAYKSVNVECTLASETYEMLVPTSAIVTENVSSYIYILKDVSTTFEEKYEVEKMLVTVIKRGDYTTAISASIDERDQIVISTNKPLHDGAEVKKR